MTTKSPHTPQTQIPSSTDEKGIIAIKPPILPPEIYERFKKLTETPFSPEVIKACNKAQREKREREEKENQQTEYIEINWIKIETQNLGRPTHKSITILKKWEKIIEWLPCCWNDWDDWYYNWHAAMVESKYLWKRIPTQDELDKIFWTSEDWFTQLTPQQFKELIKKLNIKAAGRWNSGTFNGRGYYADLWSSTEYVTTNARGRYLGRDNTWVNRGCRDKSNYGFFVRCIFPEKEEGLKLSTEKEKRMRKQVLNDLSYSRLLKKRYLKNKNSKI